MIENAASGTEDTRSMSQDCRGSEPATNSMCSRCHRPLDLVPSTHLHLAAHSPSVLPERTVNKLHLLGQGAANISRAQNCASMNPAASRQCIQSESPEDLPMLPAHDPMSSKDKIKRRWRRFRTVMTTPRRAERSSILQSSSSCSESITNKRRGASTDWTEKKPQFDQITIEHWLERGIDNLQSATASMTALCPSPLRPHRAAKEKGSLCPMPWNMNTLSQSLVVTGSQPPTSLQTPEMPLRSSFSTNTSICETSSKYSESDGEGII